jgi:prolyl-tRNA synthetase
MRPVQMCSYGIGTTRVLASIVEVYGDDAGLVWPNALAPYDIHVVVLGDDARALELAGRFRELCSRDKVSALFDERRDVRAGEKFADADLLGIPLRVVVGGRTSDGERIEVKRRTEQEVATVSLEHLTSLVVGS